MSMKYNPDITASLIDDLDLRNFHTVTLDEHNNVNIAPTYPNAKAPTKGPRSYPKLN